MITAKKIARYFTACVGTLAILFCLTSCANTDKGVQNIESFLKAYYTVEKEDYPVSIQDESFTEEEYIAYLEKETEKLSLYATSDLIDSLIPARLFEYPARSAEILDATVEVKKVTIGAARELKAGSENTHYPYTVTVLLVASDGTKTEKTETGECAIKNDDPSSLVMAFNPTSEYNLPFGVATPKN